MIDAALWETVLESVRAAGLPDCPELQSARADPDGMLLRLSKWPQDGDEALRAVCIDLLMRLALLDPVWRAKCLRPDSKLWKVMIDQVERKTGGTFLPVQWSTAVVALSTMGYFGIEDRCGPNNLPAQFFSADARIVSACFHNLGPDHRGNTAPMAKCQLAAGVEGLLHALMHFYEATRGENDQLGVRQPLATGALMRAMALCDLTGVDARTLDVTFFVSAGTVHDMFVEIVEDADEYSDAYRNWIAKETSRDTVRAALRTIKSHLELCLTTGGLAIGTADVERRQHIQRLAESAFTSLEQDLTLTRELDGLVRDIGMTEMIGRLLARAGRTAENPLRWPTREHVPQLLAIYNDLVSTALAEDLNMAPLVMSNGVLNAVAAVSASATKYEHLSIDERIERGPDADKHPTDAAEGITEFLDVVAISVSTLTAPQRAQLRDEVVRSATVAMRNMQHFVLLPHEAPMQSVRDAWLELVAVVGARDDTATRFCDVCCRKGAPRRGSSYRCSRACILDAAVLRADQAAALAATRYAGHFRPARGAAGHNTEYIPPLSLDPHRASEQVFVTMSPSGVVESATLLRRTPRGDTVRERLW